MDVGARWARDFLIWGALSSNGVRRLSWFRGYPVAWLRRHYSMEELLRHRESVREEITRGVATLRALLEAPDSPTVNIRRQLRLVNGNYAQMKALDETIWKKIDEDEFDGDLAASYELDTKVTEVRAHVDFPIPSAALSHVVPIDFGARIPDFAVIWQGKTTALSCEGKMAAETDKVVNVHGEV